MVEPAIDMDDSPTGERVIEDLIGGRENQWFDRKRFAVTDKALADALIGFANADGGTLIVGVDDDGLISGVDITSDHLNELQQAAVTFSEPPVRCRPSLRGVRDGDGRERHLLVFEIPASERVHRNQRGEVFVRYGDQNRRLDADAEREFVLERGERQFDRTVVTDATLGDLDDGQLNAFVQTMVFDDSPLALLRARHLILPQEGKDQVTWGAWLVFGKRPDAFMPQAFVRVIQYEGIAERTGERMNVVFDERAEGPLPYQIAVATDLVARRVKNVVRLNRDGRFEYVPKLPRFAWFETIVNAVTHRSYSRQGDHIRVKIFDDRMQIESPGRFPGPVRIANIRETRFSRNPSISRVLYELGLVREMNEGVNRIYDEMSAAGLPEPRFEQTDSSVRVTLLTRTSLDLDQIRIRMVNLVPVNVVPVIDVLLREGQITTREAADIIERSVPTARRYLRLLETEGWLVQISRSSRDPSGYWRLRPRSPGDPDPRT